MINFWESKFKDKNDIWGFEPSDSAIMALKTFRKHNCKSILVPGFGYGRNAKLFLDAGFDVTGIEISDSAIKTAREKGLGCTVYHGSVASMPFDTTLYDAVFCYALIHLLNKHERKLFLRACFSQLKDGGMMIFTATIKNAGLYGEGRLLSKDRYEIEPGLRVFFYDKESITREFSPFGLFECNEISEPVKFMNGVDPVSLYFIMCKKVYKPGEQSEQLLAKNT
jgi:SAM-dependent methyltransferase